MRVSVGVRVRRLQLRISERALDRPFSRRASLEIDRRLVALERALHRGGGLERDEAHPQAPARRAEARAA